VDAGVSTHRRNPVDSVPPVDESKLVCRIGDLLEVTNTFSIDEGDVAPQGATYRVAGRVYYGWDLERVSDLGPEHVRVLNASVLSYFGIVPRAETP